MDSTVRTAYCVLRSVHRGKWTRRRHWQHTVDGRHSQLSSQQHDTVSSTCVHSAETPPASAAPSSRETLRPSIPKEEVSMAEESPGPIWGCWNRLFGFPVPTLTGRIHAPGALTKSTLLSAQLALYPEAARYIEHWPHLSGQPGTEYTYLHAAECRYGELVISLAFVWLSITFSSRSASDIPDKVRLDILDNSSFWTKQLTMSAESVPTVLASSEATLGCR